MTDVLTDGTHLLLMAPTGTQTDFGGKSALAAWIADQWGRVGGRVIYLNPKWDDVAETVEGPAVVVDTLQEVAEAYRDGREFIDWRPPGDFETVSERLHHFLRSLRDGERVTVVLDEVPQLDEGAVADSVSLLGNMTDCKIVATTQSPTDADEMILKNTVPVWVGVYRATYDAWLRSNDLDAHVPRLRDHDPYQWTVMLGPGEGDAVTYDPVPASYGEGL